MRLRTSLSVIPAIRFPSRAAPVTEPLADTGLHGVSRCCLSVLGSPPTKLPVKYAAPPLLMATYRRKSRIYRAFFLTSCVLLQRTEEQLIFSSCSRRSNSTGWVVIQTRLTSSIFSSIKASIHSLEKTPPRVRNSRSLSRFSSASSRLAQTVGICASSSVADRRGS